MGIQTAPADETVSEGKGGGVTGAPELGIHPTKSGRRGLWRSSGVVD